MGGVVLGSGAAFNGVVVDGEVVGRSGLVLRTRGDVYREVVAGAETMAIFTLSEINGGGVVGMTVGVDLYVRVRCGELRTRWFRSAKGRGWVS